MCSDEILTLAKKVVEGLRVDERRIAENLRTYGPFAGTEAVLMEAAKRGGDRHNHASHDRNGLSNFFAHVLDDIFAYTQA